jgi:carbon storage regulator
MLVLSRRQDERIVIDGRISVRVIAIHGRTVRLGIEAPSEVTVHREEIERAIRGTQPTAA